MVVQGYRYKFLRSAALEEAEKTLVLALLAAEGLFGRSRVRMDASWNCDESINVIVIDAGTLVGLTVSLIFTAFITAEFGPEAFDIRRVEWSQPTTASSIRNVAGGGK